MKYKIYNETPSNKIQVFTCLISHWHLNQKYLKNMLVLRNSCTDIYLLVIYCCLCVGSCPNDWIESRVDKDLCYFLTDKSIAWEFLDEVRLNKYRSVQELCSSSKLFRYFWFNFISSSLLRSYCWEGLVWFGLSDRVWIGLVCLFHRQTKKLNNFLILINLT